MKNYKKYKYIADYADKILNNEIEHCIEQRQMIKNIVIPVFERDDIFFDEEKVIKGLELQKYFPYKLLEWEVFLFALIAGVHYKNGNIFFTDIRIIIGRGSGKNGFIDFLAFYFLSPIHGIQGYNIDILANTENQAKVSFNDVYEYITNPTDKRHERALLANFHATKTEIIGKKTNSILRYNSSSKRGKDSKRTGCIIYDEKHEYVDATNINTLRSGLGKVWHGREITISTNGHIRGAVFDDMLTQSLDILKEYSPDNRTLIFYCHIESEDEWDKPEKWVKAIPSINDFPSLRDTLEKEVKDMPYNLTYYPEYMAKRMNYPIGNKDEEVASWDDILATNQELIDLEGQSCVAGIDFSKTNDFVAAGLLFKKDEKYYFIGHGWVCRSSKDLMGIKAPLGDWAKRGLLTFVDDVEIPAELVTDWLLSMKSKYCIEMLAIDSFRFSFFNMALKRIGFDAYETKNVKLIRKSDIMKNAIIVNSLFVNHILAVGDNPFFRWCTNNTKRVTDGRGNIDYEKIEAKYRKNDLFMAFAATVCIKDEIKEAVGFDILPPLLF
jgi:phage terminase large subunit-like protein